MDISFFYNEKSGSGEIRGRQIGERLGAKLNPTSGYEDDICIYVKQIPAQKTKHTYVDIIDGDGLIAWLAKNRDVGIISTSLTSKRFLKECLERNDIVFLPEHHCNFEQDTRPNRPVVTVGTIGNAKGFNFNLDDMKKWFSDAGLNFIWSTDFRSREDVVAFYKKIDVQVCWRPHVTGAHSLLHNPLKLANGGSFGIPTVSFPEENFLTEFSGCFLPVNSVEEMISSVKNLSEEQRLYWYLSGKAFSRSRDYHIDVVAEMYKKFAEGVK